MAARATTKRTGAAPKGAVTRQSRTSVATTKEKPVPARSATKKTTAPRKVVVRSTKTGGDKEITLNAYVPSPDVANEYVGRKVFGVWDFEFLMDAKENTENVLLMGDTGSGKTMLGQAFASKLRCHYYSLPCDVSIDPTALFGKMQPTDVAGKFKWQDGPVTEIVRNGGVLNISEVNFMPPKIAASLYPLLDGRRYVPLLGHEGEVVRAHEDLLVIADMNPGYRGTMELNAAFKNRFAHKIPWGYDDAVEAKLLKFPTLRDVAKRIRAMVGTEIMTPLSTNMLMEFERFAMRSRLGIDYAIGTFVAAFDGDEQKSINDVLDLNKPNLKRDLAFALGQNSDDDDDLEEAEFDFTESD